MARRLFSAFNGDSMTLRSIGILVSERRHHYAE
jgi:hypothetical protein